MPLTREQIVEGAAVWIWFDTGAFGPTQLEGKVLRVSPKTFLVEWKSGIRQRLFYVKHLHLLRLVDWEDER